MKDIYPELNNKQVVSKKRVIDHGEVLTSEREVNAMLDLVKQETERIDSRFLEPACGTGNFLTEILERKLRVVKARYSKSQLEYERYVILAVSSIYGIDLLEDNAIECRRRLLDIFTTYYRKLYKKKIKQECIDAAQYILGKNIVHGDALTLKTAGEDSKPIVFSEWSPVNGNMLKRRDFAFHEIIPNTKENKNLSLFSNGNQPFYSDLGEESFIPVPIKEFPIIHFLRVADVEK